MKYSGPFSNAWGKLEKRVSECKNSPTARLKPFVLAALSNSRLQTLYPYTSLYFLRFGTSAIYPFNDLGIEVAALPEGSHYNGLRSLQNTPSSFSGLEGIVEFTFKQYPMLRQCNQSYFSFDSEGQITQANDIGIGIGWMLEQLYGWYEIRKATPGSNSYHKHFANAEDSVTYLVNEIWGKETPK